MGSFAVAQDRDANRQVISSNAAFKTSKTVTFAAATTGAVGFTNLFTVTGNVFIDKIFAMCKEDLTSGGSPNIGLGTANNVAGIHTAIPATAFDNGDVWAGNDTLVEVASLFDDGEQSIWTIANANIGYNIVTTTITGGQLLFYCLWRPLSSDGNLVAA